MNTTFKWRIDRSGALLKSGVPSPCAFQNKLCTAFCAQFDILERREERGCPSTSQIIRLAHLTCSGLPIEHDLDDSSEGEQA